VSQTPLGEAIVLVALLFVAAAAASLRWTGRGAAPASLPTAPPGWGAAVRAVWLPAAAEALVLTLLAALWFGALGHGGWPLLFVLLGALAGGADRWLGARLSGAPARKLLWRLAFDLARYLAAGAICAWRLT
jgi:hypothetical protein